MSLKVYLNGEFVDKEKATVSIFDHGVLYGDGVFEGIRSYSRRVFRLEEHLDRLYDSADAIRLEIPLSKEAFNEKIVETLKLNDLDDAYIRAVVTRGPGDLGLDPRKCPKPTVFIITDKIALYPEDYYEKGLPVTIATVRRTPPEVVDPRIKSLNYLNNILGKINAIDAGVQEALMLTVDGHVAEGTGDNVFIVKDGTLKTPPPEIGALEGITQKVVLDLARKRNIPTEVKKMYPEELFAACECFLTGTAAEVIPVIKIDDNIIRLGTPGEMTQMLRRDFKELTKTDGVAY